MESSPDASGRKRFRADRFRLKFHVEGRGKCIVLFEQVIQVPARRQHKREFNGSGLVRIDAYRIGNINARALTIVQAERGQLFIQ